MYEETKAVPSPCRLLSNVELGSDRPNCLLLWSAFRNPVKDRVLEKALNDWLTPEKSVWTTVVLCSDGVLITIMDKKPKKVNCHGPYRGGPVGKDSSGCLNWDRLRWDLLTDFCL